MPRRRLRVRVPPAAFLRRAPAGHRRAQEAVTLPPSGCGGSTPSRRTWFATPAPWCTGSTAVSHAVGGGSTPPGAMPGNRRRPPAWPRTARGLRGAFRTTGSSGTGWPGPVAQLARAPSHNLVVAGSSPAWMTPERPSGSPTMRIGAAARRAAGRRALRGAAAPPVRPRSRADTVGPRGRGCSAACRAELRGLPGTRRSNAAPPLARLKPGSAGSVGAAPLRPMLRSATPIPAAPGRVHRSGDPLPGRRSVKGGAT
jgi:hypothetical protein